MLSDNASQKIKITVASRTGDNFDKSDFFGSLRQMNGQYLIKYDDSGVGTSIKLFGKSVHIIRKGAGVDHRMTVSAGEQTFGVMGHTPFTVIGKRSDWSCNGEYGEIRLSYILPDISDKPTDFNLRIKFLSIEQHTF